MEHVENNNLLSEYARIINVMYRALEHGVKRCPRCAGKGFIIVGTNYAGQKTRYLARSRAKQECLVCQPFRAAIKEADKVMKPKPH